MNKRFHIEIGRNGQRWCDISIESRSAEDILADIEARFPEADGFVCRIFIEKEARRLVEVTDQARVIGITYSRSPLPVAPQVASKT
ncbi:hypothetical protein [Sphingopyxis sp. KK2]|uniref:hypothetical protein n=1 Tax=Sphingopyxis sp. KK2 TaxID=1855727 RepID=UPI00097E7069|nr:hypothetical protein [Sphingopyxis sp. KK2]